LAKPLPGKADALNESNIFANASDSCLLDGANFQLKLWDLYPTP